MTRLLPAFTVFRSDFRLLRAGVGILILLAPALACGAPTPASVGADASHGKRVSKSATAQCSLAEVKRHYTQGKWDAVVKLTSPERIRGCGSKAPDLNYYRGLALAKLKRWAEAKAAFEQGRRARPGDKRFPIELAGIAFFQHRYGKAKRDLRAALRLDPHDAYADNFLATLYALDDNLPAALKYWNRIAKPQINSIQLPPHAPVRQLLLRRAFAFSPGSMLGLSEFRTSETRLDSLGVFERPEIRLTPAAGEAFDASFTGGLKPSLGGTKLEDALTLLRGAPYSTVYPEWINIRHRAMNFTSLLRWDPNKERVEASFSAPVRADPAWRARFRLDARRENWDLSHTFFAAATPVNAMQLEKIDGIAELQHVVSGRFRWTMGLDASGRTYRNVQWNSPSAARFFRNGFALEYTAAARALLLAVPEHRVTFEGIASAQLGKLFVRDSDPFAQGEAGIQARWFPRARGDDYEMTGRLRAGSTLGTVPFDDLFILGLERDNNLWLRAHIGTEDGKKGSAPLGSRYTLANWDDFKDVYQNGFVSVKLGPFFDTGSVTDPTHDFGSRQWLFDTGLELKVRVLGGATVELFFGKDLRTGRNTFYGLTSAQ